MILQCCVCKKVREGDQWVEPAHEIAAGAPVSHGYCPDCAEDAADECAAYFRDYPAVNALSL